MFFWPGFELLAPGQMLRGWLFGVFFWYFISFLLFFSKSFYKQINYILL